MELPHWRYIRFLISKRLKHYEVLAACTAQQLVAPNEDDFRDHIRAVGVPPVTWAPKFDGNVEFRTWLMDAEVFEFWVPDSDVRAATNFLAHRQVRRAFESLVLLHGEASIARDELLQTYPEKWVPSPGALEMFCYLYWDVGSLSKPGLFEFIKAREEETEKLAAFDGDLEQTYARLGLKQKVESLEFLDTFLQLGQTQMKGLLRSGFMGPTMTAAAAALARAGFEAIALREELTQSTEDSDLRKEAALFKARILEQDEPLQIPAFDELQRDERDVIDAEHENEDPDDEEARELRARVHRLTTRG